MIAIFVQNTAISRRKNLHRGNKVLVDRFSVDFNHEPEWYGEARTVTKKERKSKQGTPDSEAELILKQPHCFSKAQGSPYVGLFASKLVTSGAAKEGCKLPIRVCLGRQLGPLLKQKFRPYFDCLLSCPKTIHPDNIRGCSDYHCLVVP